MRRIQCAERPGWKAKAESEGFVFHSIGGQPYWDESAYYAFSLEQIENDLEDPTEELQQMCLAAVDRIVADAQWMERLAIPRDNWDLIRNSWTSGEVGLYGRFDFIYDGQAPAKLMEYNADTPTSVYETAWFQWGWLEDLIATGALPETTDQFNSLHEKLVERYAALFHPGDFVHFAALKGSTEDRATVRYMEDCARQARLDPKFVYVEDIGIDADGRFVDKENYIIGAIFKLHPWEDMLRSDYATKIAASKTRFIEPAWKSILSNKGILPALWEFFPKHPNLLPAYFEANPRAAELPSKYVRKPIYSREGANVEIIDSGAPVYARQGEYGAEGYILQAYAEMPVFHGKHVMIGSWLVGDDAAGIGIREDPTPITGDDALFVPHVIEG